MVNNDSGPDASSLCTRGPDSHEVGQHTIGLMTLAELPEGHSGAIMRMDGGRGLVTRLATLGFTPGAQVTMVRNRGHGPVIVSVLDTNIALGRGQADKVVVRVEGRQ